MRLHKYFQDKAYASALASGYVHWSTLQNCRRYEGARGDQREAVHVRTLNLELADGPSPERDAINGSGQVGVGQRGGVSFRDVELIQHLSDAYVLCFTHGDNHDLHRERFGPFGVEIADHKVFAELLLYAFAPVFEGWRFIHEPMQYGTRDVGNAEDVRAPLGFLKPEAYSDEAEYRYLVCAESHVDELKPFGLHVPRLATVCKKLW